MTQGARKGMSAADVVHSCDITFCCVADSVALKEVSTVVISHCNRQWVLCESRKESMEFSEGAV